jgi:hypothetical protein
MVLENYGIGWQTAFESIIQQLLILYPDLTIRSIRRKSGMLEILVDKTLDKPNQFIVDSTMFKIERVSARVCEHCGKRGRRTKNNPYLPEILCLCWACEALETTQVVSTTQNSGME